MYLLRSRSGSDEDSRCASCPQAYEEEELLRLVYFGGVDASLRKEVWPFLLGHYRFGMSAAERKEVGRFTTGFGFNVVLLPDPLTPDPRCPPPPPPQVDEQVRACYRQTMREWLGCEEIVRRREKEQHAAALAKCSSGASLDTSTQKRSHHSSSVSNEVEQPFRSRVRK